MTRCDSTGIATKKGRRISLSTQTRNLSGATSVPFPDGTPVSTAARFGQVAFDGEQLRLFTNLGSRQLLGDGDVVAGTPLQWSDTLLGPDFPDAPAVAFHETRNRAVLFGGIQGETTNATLLVQGADVTTLATTNPPPPRFSSQMVYDRRLDRLILAGGTNAGGLNDVWALSGDTWTQLADLPNSVSGLVNLMYDSARDRVMMFNRFGLFELRGDTFVPFPLPSAFLSGARGFYDELRDTIVIMGGDVNSGPRSTTLLYAPATARPAEIARFSLDARGAALTAELRALRLRFEARGTGFVVVDGVTTEAHGLEVQVWNGFSWVALSLDGADTEVEVDGDGTTRGVIEIDPTLLIARPTSIDVALVGPPQGAMGDDGTPGSISVTVCELEVAYREP